jgi:hypothetical protein
VNDLSFAHLLHGNYQMRRIVGLLAAVVVSTTLVTCDTGPVLVSSCPSPDPTIPCSPVEGGSGCLGRDVGYSDDNLYPIGCEVVPGPVNCVPYYTCSLDDGGMPHWVKRPLAR